jgi:hypothetical protein
MSADYDSMLRDTIPSSSAAISLLCYNRIIYVTMTSIMKTLYESIAYYLYHRLIDESSIAEDGRECIWKTRKLGKNAYY